MSFYTSNVNTNVINSIFNQSKYRSEMKLNKNGLFFSNMRLLNVGLIVNEAANTASRRYNHLAGVYGQIKNISLYDGKQVLDQVVGLNDVAAFQNYNKNNEQNSDVYKILTRSGLGYVFEAEPNEEDGAYLRPTIKEAFPNSPAVPNQTQETSPLGYLNLRDIFPLLKKMEFIHTGLFKDLRLVVEYDVSSSLVGNEGAITGTAIPILVADQLMDETFASRWLSEFKSVVWDAIEVEKVYAPAITTNKTEEIKYRLNGFSGKTLLSMLIQKKPTTVGSELYLNNGSVAMVDEKYQVVLNGSNLLPINGVGRPNHRLAMLHDAYGNCNTIPCGSDMFMYEGENYVDDYINRLGYTDYIGVVVNQKVSSLDLVYSRKFETVYDERYGQALTLQVFGSVLKSIVKTKDGYSVVYV